MVMTITMMVLMKIAPDGLLLQTLYSIACFVCFLRVFLEKLIACSNDADQIADAFLNHVSQNLIEYLKAVHCS